jgi:hypothetical protein
VPQNTPACRAREKSRPAHAHAAPGKHAEPAAIPHAGVASVKQICAGSISTKLANVGANRQFEIALTNVNTPFGNVRILRFSFAIHAFHDCAARPRAG